ncbi:MAG: ATP-binding cassette domain-containing protein [Candidatus Methanofastidiosia archaeon]
MIKLKVENLSKKFGSKLVFENLSFEIESGKVFGVTGPNGSGKTTLLNILANLESPSRGKVKIFLDEGKKDRNSIGLVSDSFSLYEELTAYENLKFFSQVRNLKKSKEEILELLNFFSLKGRAEDPLSTFSSGMKQRMKLAFALLSSPQILLLDEPTSNLDFEGVEKVLQVLREQRKRGLVVLATNDARKLEWCDEFLELKG